MDLRAMRKAIVNEAHDLLNELNIIGHSPSPTLVEPSLPTLSTADSDALIATISNIEQEIAHTAIFVNASEKPKDSKHIKELEHRITKSIDKLDQLELHGQQDLTRMRKAAIDSAQALFTILENNGKQPQTLQLPSTATAQDATAAAISKAQQEIADLTTSVNQFEGTREGKTYKQLDHKITKIIESLDNINLQGRNELRPLRKSTIRSAHDLSDKLELHCIQHKAITPQLVLTPAEYERNGNGTYGNWHRTSPNSNLLSTPSMALKMTKLTNSSITRSTSSLTN